MGTIVVPLFAHYRSPNPPVQAALAGGLRLRGATVAREGQNGTTAPEALAGGLRPAGSELQQVWCWWGSSHLRAGALAFSHLLGSHSCALAFSRA
jgi:hypothetical protein